MKEGLYNSTKLLEKLLKSENLSNAEASWLMNACMDGAISNFQLAAILAALRVKGETVEEITACANVMRKLSAKVKTDEPLLIDTCGTGGDGSGTFNISTTVSLLLASAGYKIAKHGNRSMTSKSGSADLLEALGVNIMLTPEQVAECIKKIGIGFLFAPALHSSMKNVTPVRKELKVRTIFNLLGPLTNPANANVQLMGIFDPDRVEQIALVLKELGIRSAYVVSGESGMDEVSLTENTFVAHLNSAGDVSCFIFSPLDYGFNLASLNELKGGTAEKNAEITRGIFKGEITGPKRDIIILNTGFAISAAEEISLEEAFKKAEKILDSPKPVEFLTRLVNFTQKFV